MRFNKRVRDFWGMSFRVELGLIRGSFKCYVSIFEIDRFKFKF